MSTSARKSGPASLSAKAPFAQCARIYFERGWLPFPLPVKKKSPPPDGITGWDADPRKINDKQIAAWIGSKNPASNIGLRSPKNHMGIDIDAYKESGDETYARIVEEMGELPATWISSARDDGTSGIRHYRLPEGAELLSWPGKVGGGIETVHFGHRYTVAPPSVHPEKDAFNQPQVYKWYAPGEAPAGFGSHDLPQYDELTVLPEEWVDYFTKGRYAKHLPAKDLGGKASSRKAVTAWLAERAGDPCALMIGTWEKVTDDFEGASAHDSARDGLYRLACLSAEGHPGLAEAVSRLHDFFIAEVSRDDRDGSPRGMAEAENEWLRFLDGAVKKVMHRIDNGDFIGSACTCTGFTPEGRPKERLDVDNYHISEALEICYDAVRARAETDWLGMYHANGEVRELTPYGLRPVTVNALRAVVARRVDWVKWKGGEEPRPVPCNPPKDFLGTMLEDSTIRQELPEIRGIAHTPYYALVDGRPVLIRENGYHRDAKVYMQMDERLEREMVGHMREDPPFSWVEKAKKLIGQVWVDFPFVGEADRATAYAALILPFVRDLVVGPTPLHLVEAPTAGTGKGLLTDVIGLVTCGVLDETEGFHKVAVTDDRNRNVELAKEITARLAQFPRILLLDNVNHKLDSGPIASALTTETYQARVFGRNDATVQMPNRALWMATANNLLASEEIRRRILVCRLNARMEKPGERTDFKIPNLLAYVREHRPALVWSALTLVANWVAEGMPGSQVKMGSYESWVAVVGGILDCAGIGGLLENRKEFNERASDEAASLDGLVEEWHATFGRDELVSIQQLVALDAAEEIAPSDGRSRERSLGWALKPAHEKVVAGHMIVKTTREGRARYYLASPDGETAVKKRRKRGSRK